MLNRRDCLLLGFAAAITLVLPGALPALSGGAALAQTSTAPAVQFVQQTAARILTVINGPGAPAEKQRDVEPIMDGAVDVDGIARFCMGRFWREATAQQQQEYLRLFRSVLLNSITGRLGDYRGVRVTVGRAEERPDGVEVSSVVARPNNPPSNVIWVIDTIGGQPKIVDVIAEGTSLRLTQRSDYASYLARNGNNVSALIDALRQQLAQG